MSTALPRGGSGPTRCHRSGRCRRPTGAAHSPRGTRNCQRSAKSQVFESATASTIAVPPETGRVALLARVAQRGGERGRPALGERQVDERVEIAITLAARVPVRDRERVDLHCAHGRRVGVRVDDDVAVAQRRHRDPPDQPAVRPGRGSPGSTAGGSPRRSARKVPCRSCPKNPLTFAAAAREREPRRDPQAARAVLLGLEIGRTGAEVERERLADRQRQLRTPG